MHTVSLTMKEIDFCIPLHCNAKDTVATDRCDGQKHYSKNESNWQREQNTAKRLKNEGSFTGQFEVDILEYGFNYESAANEYVLETLKRFKYIYNLFDGAIKS